MLKRIVLVADINGLIYKIELGHTIFGVIINGVGMLQILRFEVINRRGIIGFARGENLAIRHFDGAVGIKSCLKNGLIIKTRGNVGAIGKIIQLFGTRVLQYYVDNTGGGT